MEAILIDKNSVFLSSGPPRVRLGLACRRVPRSSSGLGDAFFITDPDLLLFVMLFLFEGAPARAAPIIRAIVHGRPPLTHQSVGRPG